MGKGHFHLQYIFANYKKIHIILIVLKVNNTMIEIVFNQLKVKQVFPPETNISRIGNTQI